jgi:hypothetical protein
MPILGVIGGEVVTTPFFAAQRIDPSNPHGLNAQTDPDNVGPLGQPIPADGTGNEVQVYFGCWLDINQTTPQLPDPTTAASAAGPYTPVQSIQDAIRGKHQCLVAQIYLEPPEPQIAVGITPALSDKLAQRNLNIVGAASPHQIPVTFDIRPTAASLPDGQTPDELMVDWSALPPDSTASIYLPGTSADAILKAADRLYTRHGLSRADAHTIACRARGITYVPIPRGTGSNFAGLLTVDLPPSLPRGRTFTVLARQITNASGRLSPPPPKIQSRKDAAAVILEEFAWRRVLGSFQISIPVETKRELLEPEERLLSVLRWIARGIPTGNRWYPVFRRYLHQIAGRVGGLGGNPTTILPSPQGNGGLAHSPPKHPGPALSATGKVAGLVFDRFGDFIGFLLDTHAGEREFFSREREIARLAQRAWRERLLVTVWSHPSDSTRPERIIVREPPEPFGP